MLRIRLTVFALLTLLLATVALAENTITVPLSSVYSKDYAFVPVRVPGAATTNLGGINDHFDMVGTYTDSNGASHGWIYTRGRFRRFDLRLSGQEVSTQLSGINNRGWITGHTEVETCYGFKYNLYTGKTVCITYVDPSVNQKAFIFPNAINDPGIVVGAYFTTGGDVGFVFDYQGFHPLLGLYLSLSPMSLQLTGISDSGLIVGHAQDVIRFPCGQIGFLAKADNTYTTFQISTDCTTLNGISSTGSWIVGSHRGQASPNTTFVVHNGTAFDVHPHGQPVGSFTPTGINSWGVIVGNGFLNGVSTADVGIPKKWH